MTTNNKIKTCPARKYDERRVEIACFGRFHKYCKWLYVVLKTLHILPPPICYFSINQLYIQAKRDEVIRNDLRLNATHHLTFQNEKRAIISYVSLELFFWSQYYMVMRKYTVILKIHDRCQCQYAFSHPVQFLFHSLEQICCPFRILRWNFLVTEIGIGNF